MIINRYILGKYETNCYLLVDEKTKECAIIDPGYVCDELDKEIERNNYCVKHIIFTHGHFDHIGGLEHCMSKYKNALVLMHNNDVEAILAGYDVFDVCMNNKENTVKSITLHADGDIFKLGDNELKVFHTPGHTKGGVCLYSDGILFSGDTLFKCSIGRTDFIDGDFNELKVSIMKLYEVLPDNTVVYPGHGECTTIAEEKVGNPFVRL